MLTSNCYLIC